MQGCKGEMFRFVYSLKGNSLFLRQNAGKYLISMTPKCRCAGKPKKEIQSDNQVRQGSTSNIHLLPFFLQTYTYNILFWLLAVYSHPHGRATPPTHQPPSSTKRKPLCAAISEINPQKDTAPTTQWAAITERQSAPLQQDKREQRETEEHSAGRGELCCVRCPQPSASSGGRCSAADPEGGEFRVRSDPYSRPLDTRRTFQTSSSQRSSGGQFKADTLPLSQQGAPHRKLMWTVFSLHLQMPQHRHPTPSACNSKDWCKNISSIIRAGQYFKGTCAGVFIQVYLTSA